MSTCVDKISTRPRPILKSLPEYSPLPFSTYPLNSPRVHFPPTPSLTSTNFTHSPFAYDRAPIVVSENTCALPERGGRCYTPQPRNKRSSRRTSVAGGSGEFGSSTRIAEEPKGSYFHPRAFEVTELEQKKEDCNLFSTGGTIQQRSTNPCFYLDSVIPALSLSDSDSDSSCGTLSDTSNSNSSSNSPSTSIPCVVVDSTTSDASTTYPQLSSASHSIIQQQPIYSNSQISVTFTSERSRQKKTEGGKSSTSRSHFTASRLDKYGGGFSDQTAFLEGCLGGF